MVQSRARKIFYFPIEDIKSRYTTQLCRAWIPDAFRQVMGESYPSLFQVIRPHGIAEQEDINKGMVLDAVGRGLYSLAQVSKFLELIKVGEVKSGDAIYFQDFWTAGMEAIFYALHLYRINCDIYSMCHAQSVDIFDFTYPMKNWIRQIELGYAARHKGVFVASTIHKTQLKDAGFNVPIHVVSLPISVYHVEAMCDSDKKKNQVMFCSRIDKEKNPLFMLKVAEAFLIAHPDWKWVVTTSRNEFVSNLPDAVEQLYSFAKRNDRFVMMSGLSKQEYYDQLSMSKIQFNSSLQDYVSWTLLEASIAGCDICYPNFRSFPECVPSDRLYIPGSVKSALSILEDCILHPKTHSEIAEKSDKYGRLMIPKIILSSDYHGEYNIWRDENA